MWKRPQRDSLPSVSIDKLPSEFLHVQLMSHHQDDIPRNHAGLVNHDLIYIKKCISFTVIYELRIPLKQMFQVLFSFPLAF